MTVPDLGETLAEQDRAAANVFEEPRIQHHIEYRIANRHCQWIGAEGRAMRAGRHSLAGFCSDQASPKRKTAADRLGDAHNVGHHATALVGEEATGSPDAG